MTNTGATISQHSLKKMFALFPVISSRLSDNRSTPASGKLLYSTLLLKDSVHNNIHLPFRKAITAFLTITPTDGCHFKECKKHDGHNGSVVIHQLENIDSRLDRDRNTLSGSSSLVQSQPVNQSQSLYLHDAGNP